MPVGAGGCPAGASPAGYGVIDTAPAPNLTPLPDPTTGLSQGGRNIDPSTGDYTWSADGRLQGMPNVEQLVLLAIENADFSTLTEKGPSYVQQVKTIIENALAYVVVQKLVLITNIAVLSNLPNTNPDAAIALVYWIDLTTGEAATPTPVVP